MHNIPAMPKDQKVKSIIPNNDGDDDSQNDTPTNGVVPEIEISVDNTSSDTIAVLANTLPDSNPHKIVPENKGQRYDDPTDYVPELELLDDLDY